MEININDNENEILMNIATGYMKSISLKIIIDLNIPNLLSKGSKTCKELSEICKVDENNLYIILRTLSCIGIFKEDEIEDKLFSNSNLSNKLIKNLENENENMNLNLVRLQVEQIETFLNLNKSLTTGKSMGVVSNGYNNIWDYYEKNKSISTIFHNAMTSYTIQQINGILSIINFNSFETIVDLGGSKGDLLKSIIKNESSSSKQPSNIKSLINFDLPDVINQNSNNSTGADLLFDKRYKEVKGSFFNKDESLPYGDCFTLKFIIHLFKDDQSLEILTIIMLLLFF